LEFIELNRNFVRITKDAEPNLLIGRMWGRRIGGWLEWSDLLKRKRVVLLAEADSGKTKEFENAAAALRRRNDKAFYFTIEQLTSGPPSAGLDSASVAMLSNWKGSTEPAWFFLDSVDEARLNRKRFEDALRSLSRELGSMLQYARVLVSCRVSDWRGRPDRSAFLSILPIDSEPQPAAQPAEPDAALLDPIFQERGAPEEKRNKRIRLSRWLSS
jgi:hypothetical protein